jgi:D-glycero-D-manno-heptose 1,7-bisphosphate phosphatase
MKNRAIFLDREGVINKDTGFVYKIEDFKFLPNVFDSLRKFQAIGFKLFIVTNQSGIARGHYSIEDFNKLNKHMMEVFEKEDIKIEKVYFCPHHPKDNCECRKPSTFFIKQAENNYNLDLNSSWVIGDKLSDIEMGERGGCKTLLIDSRHVSSSSVKKFKDLKDCYEAIINSEEKIAR